MVRGLTWWIRGLVLAVVVVFGTTGTFAQSMSGMQAEIKTAITHAGFAAKYDTLQEVTLHLHHTINCLVGPNDPLFDAAAGNPCQGQGKGALVDIEAGMGKDPAYYQTWWAVHLANEAITMKSLPEAKAAGADIVAILTNVQNMK